jgi:Uma2 family endonuclease
MAVPTLTSTTETLLEESERLITGEEFAAMGDTGRSELVNGRIVKMSPPQGAHGLCENKIAFLITRLVMEHKLGVVLTGEAGVYIKRNPDTIRGMDVAFISKERWAKQTNKNGYLEIGPDLVVEVVSPTDRWNDVTQKLREYFSIGVRVVWVADPAAQTVFVYRSLTEMQEVRSGDSLTGGDVLPNFSEPVADFFEE